MFENNINVEMIRQKDKIKGDKEVIGATKICIRTFKMERKKHL